MVLKQRPSRGARPAAKAERAAEVRSPAAVPAGAPACIHHWLVESPGPAATSTGTCRRCGEQRPFPTRLSWIPSREYLQPRDGPDLARPSRRTSFGTEHVLSDDLTPRER